MTPRRIAKALATFGAIVMLALFIATVWIVRHRNSPEALQRAAGMVPGALLHARNFHWTQMKAGERQWILTATDASYSGDRTSLRLTDANLNMKSDDGKPVIVQAPNAVIALDGNHVRRADLSGGVTIHFGDFVVNTDSATYVPDENRVDAPGLVTIEGQGLKVTGIGLSGDPKSRKFELRQQTTTDIVPKQESGKTKTS